MGSGVSAEVRDEGLALSGEVDAETRQQMAEMWTNYDKDNSGHIEKKELQKFLNDMIKPMESFAPITSKMKKDMCDDMFKRLDANGDGRISKQEFADAVKEGFQFDIPL